MLNNFIYAQTKDLFLEKLNAREVLDEAIVFIEDTKEIWNHGHYFDCSTVDLSHIETAIAQMGESIDKVPFEKGDAENSAILKGGNNQVISEGGVALGSDNIVGLKGFYYKGIQIVDVNRMNIFVSETQQIPEILQNSLTEGISVQLTDYLSIGDEVSIVNDTKYERCGKIQDIFQNNSGFRVIFYGSNPFETIAIESNLDLEDYSIYCLDKPNAGIVSLSEASFAAGRNNKSINNTSTTFGFNNESYGKFSFTEGRDNAAAYSSHAEGRGNIASGEQSHAEGLSSTASGNNSHAEGQDNTASGINSHAEGNKTTASGVDSHAEGFNTKASGLRSHAEGSQSEATEHGSHVEGVSNKSKGVGSHAEGLYNTASGRAAHVEGENNKALGDRSHAEGMWNITQHNAEHAEGKYNISNENTIHSVGIGTSDTDRKNAHEIMQDGKHYIYGIGGYDGTNPNGSEDVATVITRVFATPDWNAKEGEAGYIENRTHFADTELAVEKQYIGMGYTIEGNNIFTLKPFYTFQSLFFKFFVEDINDNTTTVFEHMLNPKNYITALTYIGEYEYEYGKIIFNEDDYSVTITLDGPPYYKFYLEIYYVNSLKKMSSGFISDKGLLKTTYQSLSDAEKKQALSNLGIQDKIDKIDKLVNVTYSELKSLRDNSQLIPGQQYRITDYITTTSQKNTQSAGHPFDIIVEALDESTLSENASAMMRDGDDYFKTENLEAWQLKYCLDNDTSRFAWADDGSNAPKAEFVAMFWDDPVNGINYDSRIGNDKIYDWGTEYDPETGMDNVVIYKSDVESFANETDYNDKYFYRGIVEVDGEEYDSWKKYEVETGDDWVTTDEGQYQYALTERIVFDGQVIWPKNWENSIGKGVIYNMIDEYGNDCPYDFKNIQFKHPNDTTTYPDYYYTFSTVIDGVVTDHSMLQGYCYNNTIKEHITSEKQTLNNNVFLNTSKTSSCNSNSFGNNCYNNFFGNYCGNNSFGNGCYGNSFEHNCGYNSFGNICANNSFGNSCYRNSFENSCANNSFGAYCNNNFFRTDFHGNSFGIECSNNFFRTGCHSNSFGDDCNSNYFEHNCSNNSFGDNCCYNSFGGNCISNSFGINCRYNSFGINCSRNSFRVSADKATTLMNYVQYNHFDDGCSYNVIWNSDTTSSSIPLKNINVNRGVSGTSSSYNMINIAVLNQNYEIQVAKNSSGVIKIYCEADLIA